MTRKVDVYDVHGKRVYIGMIDDPSLPYLHWGDGWGFVDRMLIEAKHYELRDDGKEQDKDGGSHESKGCR